jgi:hypothetical protein
MFITSCRGGRAEDAMRSRSSIEAVVLMRTIDFANVTLRLGVAVALICGFLSVAVFVLLLVVQHDSIAEAAFRAAPLAVFALLGAFGAAMTRYLVR